MTEHSIKLQKLLESKNKEIIDGFAMPSELINIFKENQLKRVNALAEECKVVNGSVRFYSTEDERILPPACMIDGTVRNIIDLAPNACLPISELESALCKHIEKTFLSCCVSAK